MDIPKVITHRNIWPLLDRIAAEPYFQCGAPADTPRPEWLDMEVTLEFPAGEVCRDGLTTLALCGLGRPAVSALTGKEGFNAQGLEGKASIRKSLFGALMNLRDILPEGRGRAVRESDREYSRRMEQEDGP